MEGNIKIVIGSWGSYNECNERALGSKWLDLSDYSDWDEIREELKKEGFELDGIDEELFIQDVEGIEDRSVMKSVTKRWRVKRSSGTIINTAFGLSSIFTTSKSFSLVIDIIPSSESCCI